MTPRTDAVVVNFNAGAWLSRCVDRLLAEPGVLGVTVVDNASDDGSLDGLPADPRLSMQKNRSNHGYAAAANQGARSGTGEYILFANPDLELSTGAVEVLQSALDADQAVALAGVQVVDADGREQRACRRRAPTPLRAAVTMLGLEALGFQGVNDRSPLPERPRVVEGLSGALLFVRRSCFREIGGYDEGYFLHCEDLDLFERVRAHGWKILFVPQVRAVHAKGVSQRGRRLVSEAAKHRGMIRFYARFQAPQVAPAIRWIWPALVRARFVLMSPWWWLADRWKA